MHTYLRDVGLQLSRLDRPLLQIRDTKASVTIKSSLCRKKQFAATKWLCVSLIRRQKAINAAAAPAWRRTRAQPLEGGGQDPPTKILDRPRTFHMICSPQPSFENPGVATATVPTPSSTLALSVTPPTFTAWLRPWRRNDANYRVNRCFLVCSSTPMCSFERIFSRRRISKCVSRWNVDFVSTETRFSRLHMRRKAYGGRRQEDGCAVMLFVVVIFLTTVKNVTIFILTLLTTHTAWFSLSPSLQKTDNFIVYKTFSVAAHQWRIQKKG